MSASAQPCTYEVSPTRQVVPQAGGWVFVEVFTQSPCPWSVGPFHPADWADAGYYGVRVGPGWITIRANANTVSSPRMRRFEVAGKAFSVWQPGGTNSPWFDPWFPPEQESKPLGLILQSNPTLSFWTVNPRAGTAVERSTPSYSIDNIWAVVGAGDFNIDGQSDIFFRHGDGRMVVWLMSDGAVLDSVSMGWVDSHWSIRSVADVDRDGRVDLIWQHSDGRAAVWLMDGLALKSGLLLTPPGVANVNWQLATSGDFNGDGWVDLIWENKRDGRVAVWFMQETRMISGEVFATIIPGRWDIRGAGDMDGDGWPDLLWQHFDSTMAVWYMKGLVMTEGRPFTLLPYRLAAPR